MMTKKERRECDRQYRKDHKEEIRINRRRYSQTHKKQIAARNKEYYQEHKEEAKVYNKNYCQSHWEQEHARKREYSRKRKLDFPWINHYRAAKERCNNPNKHNYNSYGGKGIKFLLTVDEVKILYRRDGAENMTQASIDRVDNNGNYTFSNCQFMELSENGRKGNQTY